MNLRTLLFAIVAGVALLGAAWQLVVPAVLTFDHAQLPLAGRTFGLAAATIVAGVVWVALRRRGLGARGRPPAGLPAEVALVIAACGSAAGVALFLLMDGLTWVLRVEAAVAAAGFACGLGPAAGATLASLDAAPPRPGRGASLPQLAAGTIVLTTIAGWCLLGPVVTRQALPSTRPAFQTTVALLSLAAISSAWFLSWMLGRLLGRDLEVATVAVRWLDAPGQTVEHPLRQAPPQRPGPGSDLAELAAAADRLRARLAAEVSAYEEALARSRHADEAREEFLRVVSHELRTPLNAICGYAQLLLEGIDGPLGTEAADSVQSVLDSGRQLSALVDDVVDLAMLTSGRPGLKLAPFDVAQLLREITRAHTPLVHGRPLELRLETAEDLPPVLADRKRVRQVLTNLFANAIKFTDEGFVRCVLRRGQGSPACVEVEVVDTGVGIAPHELAGIFDEYRQGSNTGSRRQKGAGLGLAICRRLVELHGGGIRVESREGEGARFVLTLPVDGPQAARAASAPHGAPTASAPPTAAAPEARG